MRILLVEDNPGDARLIGLYLDEAREAGRLGAGRVVHATSVSEAVQQLGADEEFAVILLDLSLPDGQGSDTFRRIQGAAPDLPVVALTGNDDEQLAAELVAAGAQDYLVKGQVDARLLARALRYAVERKRSEEKLRLAARVFEIALEGILVTDTERRVISVNRAFSEITGFGESAVVGLPLYGEQNREGLLRRLWATQESSEHWQGEAICRRQDDAEFPVWLNINAVKNAQGRITHFVAAFSDITVLKHTEDRLRHTAHHDALTGLPNRLLFADRLSHALALARRSDTLAALLFIDLDRFKVINDTLGHACGDQLLSQVAERLRLCVREVDTIARLGGDEFAILLSDLTSREHAAVVARKTLQMLGHPFKLDNHEVFVTVSIGIAVYGDGSEADYLMEHADIAMYSAKRAGRNHFVFYSSQMNVMSQERLSLETDLRRAIENEEFLLHYQPQMDPLTRRVIGVEALLRWQHPERGLIMPSAFISLLEDTGLILPAGDWVMREACRQARRWLDEGLPPVRMAVNLSARQLRQDDLVECIAAILAETGLPPELLELELTESIVMENLDEVAATLTRIKGTGVRIALDDFGTGASSLGALRHFPIDTLKISSALVYDVEQGANAAIAGAVIAMARGMKLDSVAEGVETACQYEFLEKERCGSIQGFLISRPVPADDLLALLRAQPAAA